VPGAFSHQSKTPPAQTRLAGFLFPRSSQSLSYDLDGNLTFDGIWSYEWDGENRLVTLTMTNASGVPNAMHNDGNGNVMALVAQDGSVSARYDMDPLVRRFG
jgi:hypothetical protein